MAEDAKRADWRITFEMLADVPYVGSGAEDASFQALAEMGTPFVVLAAVVF